MVSNVSSQISSPPLKLIPLFKFNIGLSSPLTPTPLLSTLVVKTSITCDMSDIQCSILMAHIQSHEWKFLSPLKMQRTKSSVGRERRKKSRLLCAQDDGSHVYSPYLANSSMCRAYHLPMTETQRLTEVNWQFNFAHTTLLIYIWITLWLHQMTFLPPPPKKEKGERKKKKKTRSEYISAELESSPSLSDCRALQFTVSLFKVKMKIGAWSICIWTKRGKQIMNVQNVISITHPLFFY